MATTSFRKKKSIASKFSIPIPPEIITEIASRLPAKSVGRFRCVSKDCLSLLSSHHFIKTHQNCTLTLNQNNLIFLSSNISFGNSLYSLTFNQNESILIAKKINLVKLNHYLFLNIYGSCNGLVLAQAFGDNIHKLVILNPTTREFVDIPNGCSSDNTFNYHDDVIKRIFTRGFGYDSLTDDYKVVLIKPDLHVRVYSLRTNTWSTQVINSLYNNHHFDLVTLPGVFVNGVLHWLAKKRSGLITCLGIIGFSLLDNKLVEVLVPGPVSDIVITDRDSCLLVDFGGKLGIFLTYKGEVWLMNEYGVKESWSKIKICGFDDIHMIFRKPTIFYDNGNILVVDEKLMLIYDIQEQCFSKYFELSFDLYDKNRNQEFIKHKVRFVKSLVSPKFIMNNQKSVLSNKGFKESKMATEAGEKDP